ncbi:MAG TPA: neutral/alkaline non-lysosomal ceramidase N-terminal domain-containing protein [Bryobacteraceae bacterium]|nr:neutral/alkaline non-lysosomal ceramidase N-terminal domain-containing protein [Bryobacteraceae bacterium]
MRRAFVIPFLLLWLIAGQEVYAAGFQASVVKIDISPTTPKWLLGYGARQSTAVHDPIFHRIVAMDDGEGKLLVVSTDLCLFSPTVYDEVAGRIQKETGVPPVRFLWTVTHTHSAPEVGPAGVYKVLLKGRSEHPVDNEYSEQVMSTLVRGAKDALSKLAPARLAIGTGTSFANINRRARDTEGKISLGLNPDGPVDRQIGLIRLEKADGSPLALIANYSIHGTVLSGQFLQISGDAPGIVASYVEQELGAPMLFVNGAAGNIAPIYSVYADPRSGHLMQFNVLLGDRILAAGRAMGGATNDVKLWAGEKWVETPRKKGLGWTDDLPSYASTSASGTPMVRLPIRFVRLNDTVMWSAPVEMFCEISMAVRNQSPFANTFFFGYTNGWIGYLPTRAAFAEGGYEPATSVFSDQVERDVTEAVVTYLHGLPRR